MDANDDRPFGWGRCSVCGDDCDAQDYDPRSRTSTHRECLDPDRFCLRHGKELPMGPYGHRYGGCEDCSPSDSEWEPKASPGVDVEVLRLKGMLP